MESTNFNREMVERIIPKLRDSITKNLKKAESAEKANDLKALSEAAHTLKGTLLQCGFFVFAEEAQKIVDLARDCRGEDYSERLTALQLKLEAFIGSDVSPPVTG